MKMKIAIAAAAIAALFAAGSGRAAEVVVQVRSVEDPASPADPAVCAQAPFHVNLRLGGSLYTYRTRHSDGSVSGEPRKVGRATACVLLTSFLFPPGLAQNFYARFELPQGAFTAVGTCTFISNEVPRVGLVIAGCNLKLVGFPDDYLGGAVTSLSTFNPFRLAGFNTGSYYTFQLYDHAAPDSGQGDSEHAMEWVEDPPSQEVRR